MHMHAGTIVTHDRFGHKCRGLAIRMRNIMHNVFEQLIPIRALDQTVKTRANFALTRSCNFMMMHFNRNAKLFQRHAHRRADVL